MAQSDSVATSAIAVHRGVWDSFCPNLPAEVAAMVAPPVTVSSFPIAEPGPEPEPGAAVRLARQAKLRGNMPTNAGYARPGRRR